MIKLVLHYSGKVAFHPFVVTLHCFIEILHPNTRRARYPFVNARHAQASLFHRFLRSRFIELYDMWVDEHMAVVGILGKIILEHIEVYHHHADGQTNLGSG